METQSSRKNANGTVRRPRNRLHAFYRGTLFNAIIIGLVSFTQPGIWGALSSNSHNHHIIYLSIYYNIRGINLFISPYRSRRRWPRNPLLRQRCQRHHLRHHDIHESHLRDPLESVELKMGSCVWDTRVCSLFGIVIHE